jgi:major vault protein
MSDSNRARDLVLAPNEYAFISDQTKGNINVYVGPYKTSLANTDKPVLFNNSSKRFEDCSLEDSIQIFTTAPEGWYIVLKNPEVGGKQPVNGTPSNLAQLNIGRKVNIPGPACFALWPGQMTKVIQGHHLRYNQYLIVRVYDETEAQANWSKAVIKSKHGETPETEPAAEIPDLTMGKQLIIKGSNVSFYIPPTGVEVVRDEETGDYVREAVTLERMEYCILLDENGEKRFMRGPCVVFPEPTEEFIIMDGMRKFRAIELNELSGLYIKVIAPYEENKVKYKEGDELFITGKEQMIYYPRPEHAIIKYGNQEKLHAIAIPAGEGRYFLNRKTGTIELKKGPCMFLPDPREAVIVRRVLEPKQVELWFPGNTEALAYNTRLKAIQAEESNEKFVTEADYLKQNMADDALLMQSMPAAPLRREREKTSKKIASEKFDRSHQFTPPRTITLDTKYEGAVNINVWTGYAVLVTSKTGNRKVIVGPQSYLLEYDETLQVMELSSGTPKNDDYLIRTVYLRTLYNKVSDIIEAESSDYCKVDISLSYRVNFEGDPEKWFDVENYVKFLCEHLRSLIRNVVKKHTITDFYTNGISLIRDAVLGVSEEGKRKGRLFPENGMRIYDVEVLGIQLQDETIENLLVSAQQSVVKQILEVDSLKRKAEFESESENYKRVLAETQSQTKIQNLTLELAIQSKQSELQLARLEAERLASEKQQQNELATQERLQALQAIKVEMLKARQNTLLDLNERELTQEINMIEAQTQAVVQKAQAVTPELIAALQAFGDKALAEKLAQSMAPLSILGGKSIVEVFAQLVKGTELSKYLSRNIEDSSAI